ncbi:hypothetical protein M404DRAFT_1005157, partial [Pisolithus tinctorius Marx 270]
DLDKGESQKEVLFARDGINEWSLALFDVQENLYSHLLKGVSEVGRERGWECCDRGESITLGGLRKP